MEEANVSICLQRDRDIIKKASEVQIDHLSFLKDAMRFGRNFFENTRKFVQYQFIVAINLSLYVFISLVIHR